MYKKEASKLENVIFCFLDALFSNLKICNSLYDSKFFVPFIGFMVLKMTGLSSRFQRKNRFLKICTGSQDIKQNVPKIRSPNQTCIILDVLANISGPGAYFSKPIFALKPWVQAGRFEYHKTHNWKNFFRTYIGVPEFKNIKNIAVRVLQM